MIPIAGLFFLPLNAGVAGGSEVLLLLKDRREARGELLAVRGKVLLLSQIVDLPEAKLKLDSISAYRIEDIRWGLLTHKYIR